MYLVTRLLNAPKERVYSIRGGPRVWLRTRTVDLFIADEVFRQQVYLPGPDWIRPDDIVVDIGAQVGTFSLAAARFACQGRVLAFEPYPENFALLCRNVSLNRCQNVEAYPWAVGAQSESRELFLSPLNVGGHSFYMQSKKSIDVECVGINDLVDRLRLPRIDVLKLDCEGAEYEILGALSSEGFQKVRRISAEYHNLSHARNGDSLVRFLLEAGYEVTESEEHSVVYASRTPFARRVLAP